MKINWKVRLKNKTFIITMLTTIISFIYQILGMFDIIPKLNEDLMTQLIMIVITVLSSVGILVDPTTNGIQDSDRAMTYIKPGITEGDDK